MPADKAEAMSSALKPVVGHIANGEVLIGGSPSKELKWLCIEQTLIPISPNLTVMYLFIGIDD